MMKSRVIGASAQVEQDRERIFRGNAMERLLASNGDVRAMRTNTFLTEEQWKEIDTVVIEAAQERLVIADAMRASGLIHPLGGFGILESEFQKLSDMDPAEQSMSGAAAGDRDLPDKSVAVVPIPVTFKEFEIEGRFLLSSRNRGEPLDTSAARLASRQVAEKVEDMIWNGGDILLGGNQVYGILNEPNVNTDTLTDWSLAGTTGTVILAETLSMISIEQADNFHGPFDMFVAQNYWLKLMEDHDTATATFDKPILQRLNEIPMIRNIVVADKLPVNTVTLVQMTSDVLDLAVGQELTTVDWEVAGGAIMRMKIMTALAPRVKSDYNLASGICVGTGP